MLLQSEAAIYLNTPLQALVTLNDPVYIEAANALAEITRKQSENLEEQIKYAFLKAICRVPTDREVEVLKNLHKEVSATWVADEVADDAPDQLPGE
jgi:hypothetical protein